MSVAGLAALSRESPGNRLAVTGLFWVVTFVGLRVVTFVGLRVA